MALCDFRIFANVKIKRYGNTANIVQTGET